MSQKFPPQYLTWVRSYGQDVGTVLTVAGIKYEVIEMLGDSDIMLMRRASGMRGVTLWLRDCWPFRFGGFWGRVWTR